jgi:hypothetical protein
VFDLIGLESAQVRDVPVLNADQQLPEEDPNRVETARRALVAAQDEVRAAGKAIGWDMPKMAQAFAEDNKGASLRDASIEQLYAFRDFLKLCAQQPPQVEQPGPSPVRAAA